MSDTTEGLTVDRDGPVLTLTLDRPSQRNAVTTEMAAAITEAVAAASNDDVTRCIVLRGNGDHFCSGFDISGSNRSGTDQARPRTGHLQRRLQSVPHRMIRTISEAEVPVVSVVRGYAAGLGNALALCADFVIADTTAMFWVPFVEKGFGPDTGNSWLLPRLVGLRRANDMILRGRKIPGPLAEEWGLITSCVSESDLESAAAELVAELARGATVAYGLAKQLVLRNASEDLATAMLNEAMYEELAVRSDDFKEGMRAFAQKRAPDYTGW